MSKTIIITVIVAVIIIVILGLYLVISQNSSYIIPPGNTNPVNTSGTNFMVQGMKVEILQQGTGKAVKAGDTVTVNYVSTLENGKKIDSSYDRKRTFTFKVGGDNVIKGWDLGLIGMKVGEKRRLTVPAALAYGSTGFPAAGIPGNATLIFEIELLKVL